MNDNQIGRLGNGIAGRQLIHGMLVVLIVLGIAGIAIAQNNTDNDTSLKFKGGIGVIPVTGVAANGAATLNIVRGVSPGRPWRIAELEAEVVRWAYQGYGTRPAPGIRQWHRNQRGQSVHATLFCGAAATATAHNSNPAGVALEADGDFPSTISSLHPTGYLRHSGITHPQCRGSLVCRRHSPRWRRRQIALATFMAKHNPPARWERSQFPPREPKRRK